MGNVASLFGSYTSNNNFISSSLKSSQLVYRYTLSTCYDATFDVSLSPKSPSILISDDGRLKLFDIDLENGGQLIDRTTSSQKVFSREQVHDIQWNTQLDRFLVLTSKRLATFDNENNLINTNIQLEKGWALFLPCFFEY